MLHVPSLVGHREVEQLFRELERAPSEERAIALPACAIFVEPGAEAALVQFLTTWGFTAPGNALHVLNTENNDGQSSSRRLESLAQSHYGLAALALGTEVMCDEVRCTGHAHRALKERLQRISDPDVAQAALRDAISLMCVDEMPDLVLSSLYHASPDVDGSLRGFEEFEDVADELLSYPERIEGIFPVNPSKKVDAGRSLVSRILYELFRNTQDHARRLWDGSLNPSSVRGVLVARHTRSYADWTQHLANCQPLSIYVRSLLSSLNKEIAKHERMTHGQIAVSDKSSLTLLEISITDSGSGLAQHYLHTDLTQERLPAKREHDAVVECFNKHATSTNNPSRGLGLHRVLTCLTDLGGFLGIRTGHLSLYRDLVLRPYGDKQIFHDWDTTGPATHNLHPMAFGTAITVLIPVRSYE